MKRQDKPSPQPQPGGAPDRVELALGLTIQIKEYTYARIDVRYGSDVRPGESPSDTLIRTQEFVQPAIERQYHDVLAGIQEKDNHHAKR